MTAARKPRRLGKRRAKGQHVCTYRRGWLNCKVCGKEKPQ